ncbi:MAG: CBS domain-containing protein [Dehalococcoidia bacterium]
MSTLRVRDLMTPDVHVAHPDEPIAMLREVMHEELIRHVPAVDDDGRLVGLVSERDLLRRAAGLESDVPLSVLQDVSDSVTVRDVMTWQVDTIEADDLAATAAEAMLDNKYGCLPVLAGILTEADFVRQVAKATTELPSVRRTGRSTGRRAGG